MDNTDKFSGKTANYSKYRPGYSVLFIKYLEGLFKTSYDPVVADIGAGTGILSVQMADICTKVLAVEPNAEMLNSCKRYCEGHKNILTLYGTAEDTNLKDGTADFITAAQAFHWFDREKTKIEFRRILKPGGRVILVWNMRNDDNDFVRANNLFLKETCVDFKGFSGAIQNDKQNFNDFFKSGKYDIKEFENDRTLSLESFIGSSLSASYAPKESNKSFQAFIIGLTKLFHRYSKEDRITVPMVTWCCTGKI